MGISEEKKKHTHITLPITNNNILVTPLEVQNSKDLLTQFSFYCDSIDKFQNQLIYIKRHSIRCIC